MARVSSDSIRLIMAKGIRFVAPHGIYAWLSERIVGEVPSLDACIARISPSSLKTGFGSVKAAEARTLGRVSTELKISCSIILRVVVPQNYGASMWGEKTPY